MADNKKNLTIELNRVEGDLELKLAMQGNRVVDAWAVGRMYRGFEQILIGRHARDGLVITPRVCGICSTAHLYAAVTAIETAWQCPVGPNGTRVRNLCLMAEEVQSDARHSFLMFAIDFCNPGYRGHPLYPRIEEAFQLFKGRIYGETIRHTKQLLEIVALFGGQWPHSSYMIPGGVTTVRNRRELIRVQTILDSYLRWYEDSIIGCSSERWLALRNRADFHAWLDEKQAHRDSAAGLFLGFGLEVGLAGLGRGQDRLLSYGAYFEPREWQPPFQERRCWQRPGFINGVAGRVEEFVEEKIEEHIDYSWFARESGSGPPPGNRTIPEFAPNSKRYSWAKAPRYDGQVIEMGALAQLVVAGDPLLTSFFREEGATVWLRELARLHRPLLTLNRMRETVRTMLGPGFEEPFYLSPERVDSGSGRGLIQAARGGLGHWVTFGDNRITGYQIISPTTWNASPRDNRDQPGHWETTLINTEVADLENPVEIEHIIRSHDACLVCCVHFLDTGRKLSFGLGPGR